jgi:hypothetical protein
LAVSLVFDGVVAISDEYTHSGRESADRGSRPVGLARVCAIKRRAIFQVAIFQVAIFQVAVFQVTVFQVTPGPGEVFE